MSETRTADPFDSYMAARLGKPVAQVTAALDADDDESCPRCHQVNWGQTPDGRLECVTCGYVVPRTEDADEKRSNREWLTDIGLPGAEDINGEPVSDAAIDFMRNAKARNARSQAEKDASCRAAAERVFAFIDAANRP